MSEPNTPEQSGMEHKPEKTDNDLRSAMTISGDRCPPAEAPKSDTTASLKALGVYDAMHRYRVGDVIGQGGMSTVLHATDVNLQRPMALKYLSGHASDPRVIRLVKEARITARLQHPGILPVHELSKDADGNLFYTMPLVEGRSLQEILDAIREGDSQTIDEFPLSRLLTIYQRACDAVAYAHSEGVVHRDLKPDNIMIGEYGSVLVIDWGVAKVLREGEVDPESGLQAGDIGKDGILGDTTLLTMAGALVGTPRYMAPEQATGDSKAIDERTDVYGLGGILYSALTLTPPVEGSDPEDTLEKAISGVIRYPSGTADRPVPSALAAVAMKALSRKQQDRYQSVQDLQADVAAYQNGFATSAEQAGFWKQVVLFVRRNKLATAAAATILMLVIVGSAINLKERIKSERALTALRSTAPDLIAAAELLAEQEDLEGALQRVNYALGLVPEDPEYHARKGDLLEVMGRFEDAESAYCEALAIAKSHQHAEHNRDLCRRLTGRLPEAGTGVQLALDLRQQGRFRESAYVLRTMGGDIETLADAYKLVLRDAGVKVMSKGVVFPLSVSSAPFSVTTDGLCRLTIDASEATDLNGLRGVPIAELCIYAPDEGKQLISLHELKGMPLRTLRIAGTAVQDLTPLAGSSIECLELSKIPVSDLSPLRQMPLRELRIIACEHLLDLSKLRGLRLERFCLQGTWTSGKVRHLEALADMPLKSLVLMSGDVNDLSCLAGLQLRDLCLRGCRELADISPLKGMPLRSLNLHDTKVTDLSPLKDGELEWLSVAFGRVSDLSGLQGARIRSLDIMNSPIMDYSDLLLIDKLQKVGGISRATMMKDIYSSWEAGGTNHVVAAADAFVEKWKSEPYAEPFVKALWEMKNRWLPCRTALLEAPDKIPKQVISDKDHHYAFYPEPMSWPEANGYCESVGGRLVVLRSHPSAHHILLRAFGSRAFWIGATQTPGSVTWINGVGSKGWVFQNDVRSEGQFIYMDLGRYSKVRGAGEDVKMPFVIVWDK